MNMVPKMSNLAKICFCLFFIVLTACKPQSSSQTLTFGTSAEYPPFEYRVNDELRGFDIELAQLIAKELGKEAVFKEMQFSTILPALQNGQIDAAIATITITPDRKRHFGFSHIYYYDGIATVYKKEANPIKNKDALTGKKIGCQLGSTMEIWLKKNGFTQNVMTMDNTNQLIEALKANHIEVALMDAAQGRLFSKKNTSLLYHIIDQSEDGYAVVTQKDAPLLTEINQAIDRLKEKGEIAKLEEKWLTGTLP